MKRLYILSFCLVLFVHTYSQELSKTDKLDDLTNSAESQLTDFFETINEYLYFKDDSSLTELKQVYKCSNINIQSDTRHGYNIDSTNFDKDIIDQNIVPILSSKRGHYIRDLRVRKVKEIKFSNVRCVGFDNEIIYIAFTSYLKSSRKSTYKGISDRIAFFKYDLKNPNITLSEINFLHHDAAETIRQRASDYDKDLINAFIKNNQFLEAKKYIGYKTKFSYQNDYSYSIDALHLKADMFYKQKIEQMANNDDVVMDICISAMNILPPSYHKNYQKHFVSIEQKKLAEKKLAEKRRKEKQLKIQENIIDEIEALIDGCKINKAQALLNQSYNAFVDKSESSKLQEDINNNKTKCLLSQAKSYIKDGTYNEASEIIDDINYNNLERRNARRFRNYSEAIFDGYVDFAKDTKNKDKKAKNYKIAFNHKMNYQGNFNFKPEKYFLDISENKTKEAYINAKRSIKKDDYIDADYKLLLGEIEYKNFKDSRYYQNIKSKSFANSFNKLTSKIENKKIKVNSKIEKIEDKMGDEGCNYYRYKYLKKYYNRKTLKIGVNYSFSLNNIQHINTIYDAQQYFTPSLQSLGAFIHYGRLGVFAENYHSNKTDFSIDMGGYFTFLNSLNLKLGYTYASNTEINLNSLYENYIAGLQFIWPGFQIGVSYRNSNETVNISIGINLFKRFRKEDYKESKAAFKYSKNEVRNYKKGY